MTLGEFKAWLDGYLAAGGNDLNEIKTKLATTTSFPSYAPPDPNRIGQTRPLDPWPYIVTCYNTCATEVN